MGYPFQRRFLGRDIIFNKMGNEKNCGSRLYLLLKIVADYEEVAGGTYPPKKYPSAPPGVDVNFHCMQMSLVMSIRFIFGDD